MAQRDYLGVLSALPEPVFLVSTRGAIVDANRAAEKLLGATGLQGKLLIELSPGPSDGMTNYLKLCARTRDFIPGALFIDAAHGPIKFRCDGALLYPAEQDNPAIVLLRLRIGADAERSNFTVLNEKIEALGKEIIRRKQVEHELRRNEENLEQRIMERTARLEEVIKDLNTLSYSVSHDLRAPLRHIDGYVQLIKEDAKEQLDEKIQGSLNAIIRAARHAGVLIDELLSFARHGRTELYPQPVDMNRIVGEVIRNARFDTKDRNIEWTIATLPEVVGDVNMLRLVVQNLILNAIKYTSKRNAAKIEVASTSAETETIFWVRDNGAGFDMQYADKLFGVFQRLHRSDEFEGTGIGLANVQKLVHRHGGRVWAEAAVNQGATFYFSLPKRVAHPATP